MQNNDGDSCIYIMVIGFCLLLCIGIGLRFSNEAEAKTLTSKQMQELRERASKKQQSPEYQRRRALAEKQLAEREARERAQVYRYKRTQQKQHRSGVSINDNAKEVVVLYTTINHKKQEMRKLYVEIKILTKKLRILTQNQFELDPTGELARLISIADPNTFSDPNEVADPNEVPIPPTPFEAIDRTETEDETRTIMFIDLKARN